MQLEERARKVKLLLMDVDGVLTDGRLYFSKSGEELKVFHSRDGQGIVNWHKAGFKSGIISGRSSNIVKTRAEHLGIEFVWQGRGEKIPAFEEILAASGVTADEVCYVGDDTPDAEVMPLVGFAIAVADALDDVKASAHHVTRLNGGFGAVRELIDLILAFKNA